ncbi:HAD-IIA family hydrolase [Marinobacter apostichopi]|uniref:HAD-IIA family hydrolase n=1 Tax=Marinobacter apostichopi TaxID=3035454 RepID=UPI002573D661|nr:HAD-IIA family hydrolase [Marinobacter sp. LA51]
MIDQHPTSFAGIQPTPAWAFEQYESIRERLPSASARQAQPRLVDSLAPLMSEFDAFVFDAFGVLNTGPSVIPGALDRLARLQADNKTVLVLSNAATASHPALAIKYQHMGFDLDEETVISSRWLLEQHLRQTPNPGIWGVIAPEKSQPETLPLPNNSTRTVRADVDEATLDGLDGFIFLSSEGWNETLQHRLTNSLTRRPRPVKVANPDLVAPRGDLLTLEPGYFSHLAATATGASLEFFGKPFATAFEAALARLPGIDPARVLMVGDTLHTDILGGQAAGMSTLLVTRHGALQGMDIQNCIRRSGIYPDFMTPSI